MGAAPNVWMESAVVSILWHTLNSIPTYLFGFGMFLGVTTFLQSDTTLPRSCVDGYTTINPTLFPPFSHLPLSLSLDLFCLSPTFFRIITIIIITIILSLIFAFALLPLYLWRQNVDALLDRAGIGVSVGPAMASTCRANHRSNDERAKRLAKTYTRTFLLFPCYFGPSCYPNLLRPPLRNMYL